MTGSNGQGVNQKSKLPEKREKKSRATVREGDEDPVYGVVPPSELLLLMPGATQGGTQGGVELPSPRASSPCSVAGS